MSKGKSSNLHGAKLAKNDEFYTQMPDIEAELKYYRRHFKGKSVYCNCDDPRVSNFVRYFAMKFADLGLSRLVATCYKNQDADLFSSHDQERAVKLEYTGHRDGERNFRPEDIEDTPLDGDGDFRSEESIELLKEADIVVTNPPFSLFRQYVRQLIDHDKKFVILGSQNAITYKEIFPLIQGNALWLGVTPKGQDMLFDVPKERAVKLVETAKEGSAYRIVDGVVKGRLGNAAWFTNLDHAKRHEPLDLVQRYADNPEAYPKYDNYDAIEVSKTKLIPVDYFEPMGVPITFLAKHCPEQFEILGATKRGCHDGLPDNRKYDDYWEVRQNGEKTGSSGGKTNENANLLGNDGRKNYFQNREGRVVQSLYGRIFIQRRKP